MSGKNRIERFDARRHRLRSPVSNRRRIRKSMLDECANGGISIRHSSARILPNIYRKQELRPWSLPGGKNHAGV